MAPPTVYVVHCIDTEGPLHEPLTATFERVRYTFGVDIEPSRHNLERLRRREIDLDGKEDACALMLRPNLLAYNDTWDKIDDMLDEILSPAYRNQTVDSFGGGWVYNWFCLDHQGYDSNPRRRDIGYHNIFEHYRQRLRETGSNQDGIHFHFHPMPFSRKAHMCATHHFAHDDRIFQILARRILDHNWFPHCNRPGFHVTRPDSHWLWEQFVPFDFASQSYYRAETGQKDVADGRFGDWRRAPLNWQPYHPSHDDYQTPGDCRRWIFRCLNMATRVRNLRQEDVDQAFVEAAEGKPVVLGVTDHDFRDMRHDVGLVREFLINASERYPGVKFKFSEARAAARAALGLAARPPVAFEMTFDQNIFRIRADANIFGPQPFFAMKTRDGRYFHDNLDFQVPFREWTYVFDESSFPLDALEKVGIGANDATGNTTVAVSNLLTGVTTTTTS